MEKVPDYLDSMGRLLGFSYRAVDALTAELLAEHDLTVPQWIALSALWRHDGLTVTAIARYTKATVPAASRLIDRMVEQGLLERRNHEGDRRVVEIWLTPKAQSMSGLVNLFRDVNERILEGFSDQEIERMADCLERITANASRHYAERKADDPLVV